MISQLRMNYLSLMDSENEEGAAALRQLLGLYANLAETPVARQVEGVRHCVLEPVHRRVPEPGPVVFARGIGITLTVDERAFSGASLAFGSVLERLFARLVSINSFTEFTLKSQQRGEIGYWAPRMGKGHYYERSRLRAAACPSPDAVAGRFLARRSRDAVALRSIPAIKTH